MKNKKRLRELKEYLKVKSKEYAKQFALKKKDYMFYHSEKKMFFCIGVYTIHANIKDYEEPFQDKADIDRIIQDYFQKFKEFTATFEESDFLEQYPQITWQQEMIQVIVLIYENKFVEALEYLANRIITDFIIGNKNFTELVVEYINEQQLE